MIETFWGYVLLASIVLAVYGGDVLRRFVAWVQGYRAEAAKWRVIREDLERKLYVTGPFDQDAS